MRRASLLRLVRLSISRDVRGALSSAFGVAMGIGALVFFVALGVGVGRVVREKVFPIDARLVEVVPPAVSLGALLGGGKLDQDTVGRLEVIAGVEAAYPKMNVRVPAVSRYEGSFFGSRLRMGVEVLAVGVDPRLVAADVRGDFVDRGSGEPLPAVISTRLLEIYNKTFAPARKLPQISPQMVMGFRFPVEFNRSFVAATAPGPVTRADAEVVGVSDRGLLAGITIPLDAARRINRDAGAEADAFTAVTLVARDPGATPLIMNAVREMGLEVDDHERRLADNATAAVIITTSALALLSILICVLAAVNIAHALSATVRARAREIGVMRAVGASRGDIRALVFSEAGVVGLFGGTVGTLVAVLLALALDAGSRRYLPLFPFKPESFFAFPAWLLVGGVLLGLLAALAGAFGPSRRAAATDPARTLAG